MNKFKSNKVNVPVGTLKQSSKSIVLSQRDMDFVEYSIYGDVSKPD